MTLLTEALRRIDSEVDALVHAVDPLSDDERCLAERVLAAQVAEPSSGSDETSTSDRKSSYPFRAAAVNQRHDECAELEPAPESEGGQTDAQLARAFGVATNAPAPQASPGNYGDALPENAFVDLQQAELPPVEVESKRPVDELKLKAGRGNGQAGAKLEPPSPVDPLCRQIFDQFEKRGDGGGYVLAFVAASVADGHGPQLPALLHEVAQGLGGERPSDVLVIDTASGTCQFDEPSSGWRHVEKNGAASVIRRPVVLSDLVAETVDTTFRTLRGAPPLGQSRETLAQIITFVDACRNEHGWTLVGVSARDAGELAAFLQRCDGVLIVMQAGDTDRQAAQQLVQELRRYDAPICGGVLLEPEPEWLAAA